jgi:glycosyltransferase involved in cell wall biosynthesis
MAAISVIIPTLNRASKLVRAIASVLFQTFKDYEIIVVDDGSTDQTQNALLPFSSYIKYIRHSQNLGVSAARNTGIKASQADYLAFLDSDDYWLPLKLAKQFEFFQKTPEALICQTEEIWVRHGKRVNPWHKHLKPSGDVYEASLQRCVVSPSAVMLKRCLFDKVGLFDEKMPVCEDYDLWLRVSCRYPIHLIKEFLLIKEGGDPDQLSSQMKGMDQYRIKAMEKMIKSGALNKKQLEMTFLELTNKCQIYGNGCLKHGKSQESQIYLQLPEIINKFIK